MVVEDPPERLGSWAAAPFSLVYRQLWQQLRAAEWAAYEAGGRLGRSPMDRAIFDAASSRTRAQEPDGDRLLVEAVRRRALVDHHPDISRLRDRLDDPAAYDSLPSPASPASLRRLAAAMEPDLVALIRLRGRLAHELGAPSYTHLAMAAEGLELGELEAELRRARDRSLVAAGKLVEDAGLTIDTWADDLDRIAGPAEANVSAVVRDVADRLDCGDLLDRITWSVRDGPLAGWAVAVSIPDDVRLVVRPVRSIRDLATVLHELGHAFAYAATEALGIRGIPSDTQDEVMGTILERIGLELLGLYATTGLSTVEAAETARTATSALFEMAIQDEPERAQELFGSWFSPVAPVSDPVIWTLDTFRSVDPCRVHAYALGAGLADTLVTSLQRWFGDETRAWGRWLRTQLWAPGRRTTFAELAALMASDRRHEGSGSGSVGSARPGGPLLD